MVDLLRVEAEEKRAAKRKRDEEAVRATAKSQAEVEALSPLQGFHMGWAKPETHGFQPQEPSLKPETQHETHPCQNLKPKTQYLI